MCIKSLLQTVPFVTHWKYTVNNHIGIVLAVCHYLVDSSDPFTEVFWTQQTWHLLDIFSLIRNALCLRSAAVMAIRFPVDYTQDFCNKNICEATSLP